MSLLKTKDFTNVLEPDSHGRVGKSESIEKQTRPTHCWLGYNITTTILLIILGGKCSLAKKLQKVVHRCFKHIFNPAALKISTIC